MAPVDTKNPPPDNVQDITTATGNGQRRRDKPVPQRHAEPTAPLIDPPGDVDLMDMGPASIVTRRRYHDEPPAAREAPLEEPGDTGADQTPRHAPSSHPSQTAEDLVDEVQHPPASAPAPAPSQSDDELVEQLEEIQQGSAAAIPPVTGTAYLPADTPTSRPKPPRRGRAPRTRRTARPTLTRGRTRKPYLFAAGLLVAAVAIAAVATSGSPRTRTSARTTVARSSLVVTPTKTVNPLKLIAAAIAPAVKKQEAADRTRAPRAPKKTSRRHHTQNVKRTAPPAHPATSAPSQVATTTPAPAPATSSNSYHPATTEPRAPSQQAGPTGPGTTVGKNCDPQCS